jgi:signal transduction histidine kinase
VEELATAIRRFGGGHSHDPVKVRSNDEVGTLADAFEDMRQSLQEAQEELVKSERLSTVGSMANSIIHDFKQPITTIQGFTDLLSGMDISDKKRREYGDRILDAIRQMMGMINDLLDFARGKAALHLEQAELNAIVQHVVEQMHPAAVESNIQLTFDPGEIAETQLDRFRIQRVIENLVGNAREAISGPGRIDLATTIQNGGIELSIHDTGRGIPETIRENLFEPFISEGKPTGTGLGLAISKRIIEEHGGKITFTTTTNEGTTFHVWLPKQ